ncbi:hypothetical protein PS838_01980 [Pseudomonas fluorescens]|jgi:uncharacterized delta-60 repeat protein|nr:hypothetical protein PS838_01980 [Pseudomonas fluorescens]
MSQFTPATSGAAGELDPSFGPLRDGKLVLIYPDFESTNGQLVSEAPDGKIYIGGSSSSPDTEVAEHFTLTRVLSNGTLDHDFGLAGTKHVRLPLPGTAGLGTTPHQLFYIRDKEEDKILISVGSHTLGVGSATETNYLVRLTLNGELDKSFGNDGILILNPPLEINFDQPLTSDVMQSGNTSSSRSVHTQDGKIYVISSAVEPGIAGRIARVMRYDYDGEPDLTFNKTGYTSLSEVFKARSSFNDIVVQDGKITVCGWAGSGALLARLNFDGSFDKSFAGDGYKLLEGQDFQFTALAVLPDGRTVATGFGFSNRHGLLAAYTPGGQIDRTFNQGAPVYENFDNSASVMFMGIGSNDGKIIVSGRYIVGQTPQVVTARYLVDGQRDTTFGKGKGWVIPDLSGYIPRAWGMSLQADGKILVISSHHPGYFGRAVIVTRLLNSV